MKLEIGKVKYKTKQEQKRTEQVQYVKALAQRIHIQLIHINNVALILPFNTYIYNLAVLSNSESINPNNSCLYLQTEMNLEKVSHYYVLNRHFLIYDAEVCLHHGKSNGTRPIGKGPDF